MTKRKTKKKATAKGRRFDAKAARERLERLIVVDHDPWSRVDEAVHILTPTGNPLRALSVAELVFEAHQESGVQVEPVGRSPVA